MSGSGVLPVLRNGRCLLIPLTLADTDWLHGLLVEPFVRRYLLDDEVIPREAAERMIEERLGNAQRGLGIWAIEAEGRRVGCVALTEVSGLALAAFPALAGEVEPVIALHEPAAGQGLAGEALDALLAHIEGPPLRRALVAAMADAPNERSHQLLLRHGFAPIGTAPGPRFPLVAYERRSAVGLERAE